MGIEVEEKAVELEGEKISEIDIDVLVNDCVNVEQGYFLGENNFNEFILKLGQQIEGEYRKLKNKILEIITNRALQEKNACLNQGQSQIEQRKEELMTQFQQEMQARLQSMSLQNFLAEQTALCTSGMERINNAILTIQRECDEKLNYMCNTTISAINRRSDEVLKLVNTKIYELTTELAKMRDQGHYIKVEAIEEYNKGWLQALNSKIAAIANNSVDQIAQRSISFDYKSFAQFIEESGRKEEILHKDQIQSLGNKCETEKYILSIGDLEKLLDIIDEPRCASEHNHILQLICKSVINGTQLSQVMFNKLEHLLDQREYVQSVIFILLENSTRVQKIPDNILSKLFYIAGNKDYSAKVWNGANLIIACSLAKGAELSDGIITSLIDNNFVLKIYSDDIALEVADRLHHYFKRCPKALEKYGDKIIDIIVDNTLSYNIRCHLCLIVNDGINKRDSSYHLSQENIEKLERAFEDFPVNQALEIFTILASIGKVHDTKLSNKTLEKVVNAIGDTEIYSSIRIAYANKLLVIINSGQEIAQSLVMVLIEYLACADYKINKKVNDIVQYLFEIRRSDYNLSTQEVDVINKILSNTSIEEIQDTLANIIGYCAGKNITTKGASDSIYKIVHAEHFTKQVLFALQNISKNDKRALPVRTYTKLIDIGLNCINIDLRIFALESVINLAECSGDGVSVDNIDRLLNDHNTEIKAIAIRLVKDYFNRTKQLPGQLVESIGSNSKSSELLSKAALEILSDVVDKGEELPQQALELCYWVLLNHSDQYIRDRAFNIFKQCRLQHNFERSFENALVMEGLAQLIISEVDDKQIDAAEELEKLAAQGLKLTKSCWQNLNKILAGSNVEILDIAAKIIAYAADSAQEVPTDILITLKNCRCLGEDRPLLVMALYKLIKATSYSDDDIVQLAENLLVSKRSSASIQEYMMLTLKILTGRGEYLSDATIEYISTSLMNVASDLDEKVQIGFAAILRNVVSNGQDVTPSLYKSLICSINTEIAELYSNVIKCLEDVSGRGYNFASEDTRLIKSLLERKTSEGTQNDVLKILQNISFNTKEKFAEVELDAAINGFGSSRSNEVIRLLSEVEFVAPKIVEALKNYLGHTDAEIVELAIEGLGLILGKGEPLNLTAEHVDQLSLRLDGEGDNEDIIKLLKNYQKQGNSLPKITRVRLINWLDKEGASSSRTGIIELLEGENLSKQERDFFYLATEAKISVRNLQTKEQELYQIIKACRSKITLGQGLNTEQYELLSEGLRSRDSKVIKEVNECIEVLLVKKKTALNASFVEVILPLVGEDIFLVLIKHLLSVGNIGVYSESLLNSYIGRFEIMLGTRLREQEVFNIIAFIDQQKVSLTPAMIQYVEQCLDNIDLQIAAFKLLKQQVDKGVYSLSDKCWSVIDKLAKGIEYKHEEFFKDRRDTKDKHEYLDIFVILLDIKHINREVLNNLARKYWARELLIYDLIGRMGEVDDINAKDVEDFDKVFMALEAKHKYDAASPERDKLLLSLIKLQQVNNYSCKQVMQILRLLIDLPGDTLNELDKAKDVENELQLRWLRSKFLPEIRDEELQLLRQRIFQGSEWDITIIQEFWQRLPKDASIKQISRLLKFAEENKIALQQLNELIEDVVAETGDDIINRWLEVLARAVLEEYLAGKFVQFPRQSTEWDRLIELLEIGWSIKAIKELADTLLSKSNNKLPNLCKLLKCTQIIFDYKIAEGGVGNSFTTVLSIIRNSDLSNIESKLHKLALAQNFHESTEKDIETLLSEICLKNQEDECIKSLIDNNILKNEMQDIERSYNSRSEILANNKPIKHWSKKDIQRWSKIIKEEQPSISVQLGEILAVIKRYDVQQAEILAVIKRANILDSGHQPRIVQQLAVLLMLHNEDAGRLVQVATGEGKSMIVAMLAVVKALGGEFVDIVTSSSVLAKRDAEEKAGFYAMFNLKVGDNSDSSYLDAKAKDCYSKNIVYGSVENYQFDLLRDIHFGSNIREDRVFGVVIIDEVDSMLIDEAGKIAKLSAPLPQMEYLETLLSLIWKHLEKIEQHLYYSKTEQQLLWIRCDFTVNNGEICLGDHEGDYADNVLQVHNRFEYIRFLLRDYVNQYISKSEGCVVIPAHLRDFALLQTDQWINSALCAKYVFAEGKHYLVAAVGNAQVHKIVPVDFANTGILQFKTSWSNGLHQFLEIKHNLKISPESLTTSFISNMGLFNKYGKKIFGMTGTLGNKDTQALLEDIYPIKISVLPTYKEKQFLELPGVVATNRGMWIAKIVESVISEANRDRAVLVICETINDVDSIKSALRGSKYPGNKVYRYARNDNEEYLALNKNVDAGEVILATNLAGRGTDFKTTRKVEKAGGLHVCLTFLASNERVEEQAFGRTSRQGKSGTGQLIVNGETTLNKLNYNYTTIEDIRTIKDLRDAIEQTRLKKIKYTGLYKTLISDELFLQFNELYQRIREGESVSFKLRQLEELWGFWLHEINLDEEDEVDNQLAKISFQSYLQERKLHPHSVIKGEDSFYYSIVHQLKHLAIERYQAKDIDTLKQEIIRHIIANPELYNNVAANIDEFAHAYFKPSQWHDDLFIKAVMRVLQVNIVLIKSDHSYKTYQREGAVSTIYIGHEINGDYLSLIKDGYKAEEDANVEIDTAEVKQVSTDADNSEIILEAINELEAQLAEDKGEEKRRKARAAYDKFAEEISGKYKSNEIAKNPSYETLQGNVLLKLNSYDSAIVHYNKAIGLDAIYSFAAHYNKAYAITKTSNNTEEAKMSLLSAKEQLEGHIIPQLEATQMVLITDGDVNADSELSRQIANKINLFKLQLDHINKALGVIESVEHKNQEVREKVASGETKENEASKFIIEVEGSKSLKELFKEGEAPEDEISELEQLGLENLFTIKEVELVPPKESGGFMSSFLGFCFGVVQIAFGAVVAVCGGLSLGVAMIVEGVKDVCAVVTGDFDKGITLKEYFKSKMISYAVSMVTMGWDNFKKGIEAVKAGATAAASGLKNMTLQALGKEVAQQGALATATGSITSEVMCKAALEVVKQEVPKAIAAVGAQRVINFVADRVADSMVENFHVDISKAVHEKVSNVMNTAQTQRVLDRAILIDTILGRQEYTNNIMKEMAAILKPEEAELIKAAEIIIKAAGYAYSTTIGNVITAAEKAATLLKIVNITTRFCNKLNSRLGVVESNLPSNAEMFGLYTQHFLTKEDSKAIYNNLISTGILNDAGAVIEKESVKIIEKIMALDLAKNNQFKNAIIKFCIQSQDLQRKDKQETRDRIAFNAEQMITNRIIHLVKAELVSPAVSTVMGSTVSAIKDKLRQASEESKYRVRKEMQKHYQKVTLTVDNANTETGLAALATSPAGTKASSTLPLGAGSSATEPSTSSSKEDSPSKLPKGSGGTGGQAPISALDLLIKPKQSKDAAAAAAVQKALDAWYEDPRVKCHLPYEHYLSSGAVVSHNHMGLDPETILRENEVFAKMFKRIKDEEEAGKLLKGLHNELTPSKETDELLKGMSEEINTSMGELDGLLTRMRKELNAAEQASKNKAMLEEQESIRRMIEESTGWMKVPVKFETQTITIDDLTSGDELFKMLFKDSATSTTTTLVSYSGNDTQSDAGNSSSDEQKALCMLDQGQTGVDVSKINSVQKSISQGAFRLLEIYREVEERKKEDIATYSSIVVDPAIIDAEKHPGMLRTLVNADLLAMKYVGKVTTDLALKYSPTEFSTAVIAGGELIGYGVSNVCNLLQQVWEACAPNIAQESARALGSKMGELHQILKENTTSGEQFAMYLGAGLLGDKAFSKLFSAGGNKIPLPSVSYAEVAAAPVIEEGMLGGFVCRDRSSGKVVALFDSVKLTQKSAIELPNFAGLYGKEAVEAQLQHAQMIKRHVETMIEHGAMAVEASTSLEQEIALGKLVKQYQRQYGKYQQLSSLEEALAYELKMVGKGQVTGTPGHAEMSNYIAKKYAEDPNVAFVFLDQGVKKITGLPIKPNRRPDVVVVYKNGRIDIFEVRSMTDADAILKDRMAEVMGVIPQSMHGKQDVIEIPGVEYKNK